MMHDAVETVLVLDKFPIFIRPVEVTCGLGGYQVLDRQWCKRSRPCLLGSLEEEGQCANMQLGSYSDSAGTSE